jgi:hypothetical protein
MCPRSSMSASSAKASAKPSFCSARIIVTPADRQESREQVFDDDRRQAFERLVEQQQLRPTAEGARDRQHLLLAAAQPVAGRPPVLGEQRKEREDALRGPPAGQRRDRQVFGYGQRRKDLAFLRHITKPEAGAAMRRERLDRPAIHPDRPAMEGRQTHQGCQQRRLAGAVAAKNGECAAGRRRQRDAIEHYRPAPAGDQAAGVEAHRHIAVWPR